MDLQEATRDINLLRAVVSKKVELNTDDYGLCPFHEDSDASFHLFKAGSGKARFYCFGCEAQGDGVDFVRRLYSYGFKDAVSFIAAISETEIIAQVSLPQGPGPIGVDCFRECKNYANLKEDYELLLAENKELRERLDMPDFRPRNEDRRLRQIINVAAEHAEGLKKRIRSLEAELVGAKSQNFKERYETLLLRARLAGLDLVEGRLWMSRKVRMARLMDMQGRR
jgi:hypothetical protein